MSAIGDHWVRANQRLTVAVFDALQRVETDRTVKQALDGIDTVNTLEAIPWVAESLGPLSGPLGLIGLEAWAIRKVEERYLLAAIAWVKHHEKDLPKSMLNATDSYVQAKQRAVIAAKQEPKACHHFLSTLKATLGSQPVHAKKKV
jgi:hypothetical protein